MREFRRLWISILIWLAILTVMPVTAAAQLLPGDLASLPAAGDQSTPQIARGGASYLMVWADTRTTLTLFLGTGGPYNGDRLGTMTDIYAARLDATGTLVDSTPIIVSQAMYNQVAPRVGWNGQNWLVVWMSERATDRYHTDLLAARIAPDGTILDDPPLVLKTNDTLDAPMPWRVSSDGSNWTIVYRGLDVAAGIFTIDALRVANDGTILNPGGTRLREDFWNSGATNADIAFAGDEYLLTWLEIDGGSGTWAVRGQRVSPTLATIGPVFTVDLVTLTSPIAPRVASDGVSFLVVWFEDRYYGWAQVLGARVSHTGQVLDPSGLAITPAAGYTQFAPDVVWDGHNYFVAYNKQQTGFDDDLYVTRVSAGGVVLDPSGLLVKGGAGSQLQPTIAAAAIGGAQVSWTDTQLANGAPQDVWSAVISPAGTVSSVIVASRGAARQTSPRVAAGTASPRMAPAADVFLVVFISASSGVSRVVAQRLDGAGSAIDPDPIVLATTASASNPAVAWNGSEFLGVWQDSGQIYGRRVLPSGAVLDASPLPIMRGAQPDVAALGDVFLVVGNDAPADPHYRFTFAVRVSASGAVLGPPLQVSGSFTVSPAVTTLGSRWLVLWEAHPTHDNPVSSINGAFVNADGSSTAPFMVSGGLHDVTPAVTSAGKMALIAWGDGNIYGRRILSDGTLLDTAAGIVISAAPGGKFTPAVTWDGMQFLATWVDQRNDPYPNQVRGDIYGARVSTAGVVLDPAAFPVANSPLPDEMPTVVSGGGTTLFAYATFRDGAPYAAYRIALRRFPFDEAYSVYAISTSSSQDAPVGGSATFSVVVKPVGGFSGTVDLSAFGLPAGVSATFDPPSIAGGGTSTLTITADMTAVEGIFTVTVAGTSGVFQNTASIALRVGSPPPLCPYALSAATRSMPASGGSGMLNVTTQAGCAWTTASDASWLTVTSGASGSGNATVAYAAAANTTSSERTGTLTVAGQPFAVTQAAGLFSVSGRVVSANGTPLAKVTMIFSVVAGQGKAPVSVVTDSNGYWTQTGFRYGTTYNTAPSRQRYEFAPVSRTFTDASSSLTFTKGR